MANKYLSLVAGVIKEVVGLVTSSGATDAGKIVALDSGGKIDRSVLPIYTTTIGNGSATSFTITHNLGTRDVQVTVYAAASPYAEVIPDVQHTSTTTVTLIFATAPTTNQYNVVVS